MADPISFAFSFIGFFLEVIVVIFGFLMAAWLMLYLINKLRPKED